jgi:8-oxo-dGTP pyrophosphatase MutT (NUDIX family)
MKAHKKETLRRRGVQYAALPYRHAADGTVEVLMVTSLDTRRWILPKGWPMKGRPPHATAAREAFEEAGVLGAVKPAAIGDFEYDKRLRDGSTVRCRVQVFPLAVERQRRSWPERDKREARWFSLAEGALATGDPGLVDLLSNFSTA